MELKLEELTEEILRAAIEVQEALEPGLLESACQECLCHELRLRELAFEKQRPLPVAYKGVKLDCGSRADIVDEGRVVVGKVRQRAASCPSRPALDVHARGRL